MKYGFVLPYGDAWTASDLAVIAEDHGCDAFFVWEGIWAIDAWVSLTAAAMRTEELTPAVLAEAVSWIRQERAASGLSMESYAITVEGTTSADDPADAAERVRPWAKAGATWWIDADWSDTDPARVRDAAERRLRAGPPRLDL